MEEHIERSAGLVKTAQEVFKECYQIMESKNIDYSGKVDSLRNFRVSAEVAGIKMSQGVLNRLMDKMMRTGNLINKEAAVKDESIFDTVLDAVNYCVILYAVLKEERNG